MKKLTLFASMFVVLAMNSQNVLYQEDFESYTVGDNVGEDTDIPPTFLSYDVDGDGFNWGLSNPDNFYQQMFLIYPNNFIMSASYITEGDAGNGNQGAVNANNILILPQINIPAGATDVNFSYYRGGGTSTNFFSETYYVTVTSTNDEATILAATPIYSETLANNAGLTRILNLDDFVGQDVYISFRHQTSDQWMLGVDDLKITAGTLGVVENVFKQFSYFVDIDNHLNLKSNRQLENIQIFNVLGQSILSKDLSKNEEKIDISSLRTGIYIFKVAIDGRERSFKIAKR